MHTVEVFSKPGLESPAPAEVPAPPRELHPVGIRASVLLRFLLCIISYVAAGGLGYLCLMEFLMEASFLHWFILIVLLPFCLLVVPWYLISTFKARMTTFHRYRNIYQNGILTTGAINMLTRISGRDMDSHCIQHSRRTRQSKIRVDYTFLVDNAVKTGTVLLREQSIDGLAMNSEILVLYLPDDPTQSMIYPTPGYEFFAR